jgi:hypothetical protein
MTSQRDYLPKFEDQFNLFAFDNIGFETFHLYKCLWHADK